MGNSEMSMHKGTTEFCECKLSCALIIRSFDWLEDNKFVEYVKFICTNVLKCKLRPFSFSVENV